MASERMSELRAMHRPVGRRTYRDENRQPLIIRACREDDHDWPCETAWLLDLLAERDAEIGAAIALIDGYVADCRRLGDADDPPVLDGPLPCEKFCENFGHHTLLEIRATLAGGEVRDGEWPPFDEPLGEPTTHERLAAAYSERTEVAKLMLERDYAREMCDAGRDELAERDAEIERLREVLRLARGALRTAHKRAGQGDPEWFVRDVTRIEIERIHAALAGGEGSS